MPFGEQNHLRKRKNIKQIIEKTDDKVKAAKSVVSNVTYTDDYIESVYLAWFSAGCPKGQRILDAIPEDELGRKPSMVLFNRWRNKFGWDTRANGMALEARKSVEKEAIEARAEMLRRHATVGEQIMDTGFEYILENGVSTATEALRAIQLGMEMEKQSRGYSEFANRLAGMPDDKLMETYKRLSAQISMLEEEDDPNVVTVNPIIIEEINASEE